MIEKLSAAGVTTVEALADMTPEQLEAIEGIGPKTVEKISLAVNNYFSSLEAAAAAETPAAAEAVEGQTAEPPAVEEPAEPPAIAEGDGPPRSPKGRRRWKRAGRKFPQADVATGEVSTEGSAEEQPSSERQE